MRKNSKLITGAVLTIALTTSYVVHAEGFFSGLFSGSKNGADFKSLMSYVPADTAYLMANKESIPEKVMDYQLQRGKDMLNMIKGMDGLDKAKKEGKGPEKFFTALLEDYSSLLADDKFAETGLSLKANSVIYGYKMMPVIRLGLADKDKTMAMIKRAEEKSDYKVDFSKCGKFDCFEATDPDGAMSVMVVFLENQFVLSAFPVDKKDTMKKHLIGEANPKTAYSLDSWDAFLKENNYPGYGDGFIDLKKAFAFAKPLLVENNESGLDEKSLNACLAVAEQHLDNMPEIIFGTKNLEEKIIDYELLFKTSEDVSSALQTLANKANIEQRTDKAIFDVGINIDFAKLRDALTQYSNFLIASGEANKCPVIKAQDVRKGMGGMAMVMNMGLSQFNSIYASISDIELDKNLQPKKIEAMVSLGSDDPAGLIAMAGMMAPPIMSLKVPTDGTVIKVPDGIIPNRGGPAPEIFLSQNEKALNIMLGNDKPALVKHNNETAELSFSSIDFEGYMKTLVAIMDSMPKSMKGDDMPDLEMLKKVGKAGGKISSVTSADKRGLTVNYHIEY